MAKAKSDDGSMNKRQLVQAAFEAKGDISPGDLQAYISATYGQELPINIISSYKSQIKKTLGLGRKNKKRGRKAGAAAAPKAASGSNMVNLGDLEAVNAMVRRIGADKVIALANLAHSFSKLSARSPRRIAARPPGEWRNGRRRGLKIPCP